MVADARALEKKEQPKSANPRIDRDFRGSWSGYERDCMFLNPEGPWPKFYNTAYLFGLDFDDDGRSVAPADIDGDGDIDLVMLSLQGLRVMENTSPRRHFARIRLRATKTDWQALNAMVKLTAGGVTQQDYVKVIDGFMAQVPADMHFGLADAAAVERLEVTWPSGATQTFTNLPADRLIEITEGDAQPRASELKRWPDETRPHAKPSFSFEIAAPKLAGGDAKLAEKGKPALVNFWSPTCGPCKEELPQLARLAEKHGAAVQFAGVSAETKDVESVKASVKAFGLGYPQFLANDALVRSFFGAEGKVILPSTFVFDAGGRLRRVFQRPVTDAEIESLLDSLRDEGIQAGDLERRGSRLVEQGRYEEGLDFLSRAAVTLPGKSVIHYHMGIAYFNLGRDDEALRAFTRAVEAEPQYARARFNLGETLRKVGRYDDAMEQYQAAIRIRGEDYNTLWSLGDAAMSAGKNAAALDAFDRAEKLDAKPVGVLKARARLLIKLNQPEEARKALQKVIDLDPADAEARRMLSQTGGGR